MTFEELENDIFWYPEETHRHILKYTSHNQLTQEQQKRIKELIYEDLDTFPTRVLLYYRVGLLTQKQAQGRFRDTVEDYPLTLAKFYQENIITLEQARKTLKELEEFEGTKYHLEFFEAGILTKEEIEPLTQKLFFCPDRFISNREKLLKFGFITQEYYDQYKMPALEIKRPRYNSRDFDDPPQY